MISKAERKRRKRARTEDLYKSYLNDLEKAYRGQDNTSFAYSKIFAFQHGVYSMCNGGEYSYWSMRFNEIFCDWKERNQDLFEVGR